MSCRLTTIEINAPAGARHSIIWLHGLGADGHDFEGIVPELQLTQQPHIRFVFPNAPVQPVTINGGMKMRAWYDIFEINQRLEVDINGICRSASAIGQLIDRETAQGIPAHRIVLAGFSQGGTIALQAGLQYPQKLAGIIALSTYLPPVEQLAAHRLAFNRSTPILIAHGVFDPVIAIKYGKMTYHDLANAGYAPQWHEYEMAHTVCPEEIRHVSAFIDTLFGSLDDMNKPLAAQPRGKS